MGPTDLSWAQARAEEIRAKATVGARSLEAHAGNTCCEMVGGAILSLILFALLLAALPWTVKLLVRYIGWVMS